MLQKIKFSLVSLISVLTFSASLAVAGSATVMAQSANIQCGVITGANNLQITNNPTDCTVDSSGSTDKVNQIITDVINIFSVIVGVIAVIMIVVGGFRYITSGGQTEKVTGAKNTILYAIIGLIIVALAQVVVKFVLAKTTSAASG